MTFRAEEQMTREAQMTLKANDAKQMTREAQMTPKANDAKQMTH
jgi:hypothetical protein